MLKRASSSNGFLLSMPVKIYSVNTDTKSLDSLKDIGRPTTTFDMKTDIDVNLKIVMGKRCHHV